MDSMKMEREQRFLGERVQAIAEGGIKEVPKAYIRPLHERPSFSSNGLEEEIPIIDLSLPDKPLLLEEIRHACSRWGFFQVLNHRIPRAVLESMRDAAAQFLALPMSLKMEYACKPGIAASEGYGSRMLVKEEQVLDWRDYFDHHTLPLSRRNPDNWPRLPLSYRKATEDYSAEMLLLAQKLLRLISESLGLRPSYIEDMIGEPYQNISLNYYPPCPQPDLTLGLQSHSDLGAITLLMQDDGVEGLQVRKDGNWVTVKPVANAIVVNLADQLQILSNGRYKSVEHRAVVNASKERVSIATFYDPSKDTVIFPAPGLVDEEHPPLYGRVLFSDHVSAWYYKGPEGKKVLDSLAMTDAS